MLGPSISSVRLSFKVRLSCNGALVAFSALSLFQGRVRRYATVSCIYRQIHCTSFSFPSFLSCVSFILGLFPSSLLLSSAFYINAREGNITEEANIFAEINVNSAQATIGCRPREKTRQILSGLIACRILEVVAVTVVLRGCRGLCLRCLTRSGRRLGRNGFRRRPRWAGRLLFCAVCFV